MPERLVKDIMVPLSDYTTVNVNATIGEAIKTLKKSFKKEGNNIVIGHRSAIVLDKTEVVGILTLRTLLKAIEYEASKNNKLTTFTAWAGFFNRYNLLKHTGLKVKDIMRSIDVAYVRANDTIVKAAHTILTYQVNSLPVIEAETETLMSMMREYPIETRKAVGVIRTIDIFDIIGDLLEIEHKVINFPIERD